MLSCFSRVWLFATPWIGAHQAPLSMGFSRQEYRSRLIWPPPGDLPDPGIELTSPALAGRFFTTSATWGVQKTCKGHKVASALIMNRNFWLRRTGSLNSLPGPAETLESVVWQFLHLKVGTCAKWEAPYTHLTEKRGWFFSQRLHTCNSALCFFSFLNGTADGSPTSKDGSKTISNGGICARDGRVWEVYITSEEALSQRTSWDDGTVLYLDCPVQEPPATWALAYLKCD